MLTQTPVPSASTSLSLPSGVQTFRHGLVIAADMPYDAWLAIGTKLTEVTGATMWMLGDWLAYGQFNYDASHWGKRTPNELYARLATETGYAEGTLRNAKCVCQALPLSRRRDKLTFGHAQEIVGRTSEDQFDHWIERTVNEGLSQKGLREKLRKAAAIYKPEAHDTGTGSFLETSRQFSRDFLAECDSWTPKFRAEVVRILTPVMVKLS
jgi:hypothetical protein